LTHIHASFSGVIYFEATAFFSPSPPSAFGVIYFEAMRLGLPHALLLVEWAYSDVKMSMRLTENEKRGGLHV